MEPWIGRIGKEGTGSEKKGFHVPDIPAIVREIPKENTGENVVGQFIHRHRDVIQRNVSSLDRQLCRPRRPYQGDRISSSYSTEVTN